MNDPAPIAPEPSPHSSVQPCSEACAAFRRLSPDRWSEFGLCLNPLSPRCGYPARVGHECAYFRLTPVPGLSRAS